MRRIIRCRQCTLVSTFVALEMLLGWRRRSDGLDVVSGFVTVRGNPHAFDPEQAGASGRGGPRNGALTAEM